MLSIGFPDWKKIGWHVGKKLRDIINPPADTGPSREERRAQRLRDGSRGLIYFDDFDELEAWSIKDVDPFSRANTPLLKRSASRIHDHVGPTTLVLLCHDYNGGYHDYESVRPSPLKDKLYACNYPQYVDTFVYFSHKLVCIPPPTWINTMHRNGVKVLGTFIVERGSIHIERMLDQEKGEFLVAKQLAVMVRHFLGLSLPIRRCSLSRKTSCRDKLFGIAPPGLVPRSVLLIDVSYTNGNTDYKMY